MPVCEVYERTTTRFEVVEATPTFATSNDEIEAELGRLIGEHFPHSEPFGVAHYCTNPAGHHAIPSCRDIVCAHCGRFFWR